MNFKTTILKSKPFTWLQTILPSQAFSNSSPVQSRSNGAMMNRSSAESINWLKHLFNFYPQAPLLAAAGISQPSEENSASAFYETISHKLYDSKDHYRMINSDQGSKKQTKSVQNGEMAPDEKEIKQLGKQMDKMRTNKELKKYGLDSDPIQ